MRKINCHIAGIMAAVLVLQTPIMASANHISVSSDDENPQVVVINHDYIVDSNDVEKEISKSDNEITEDDVYIAAVDLEGNGVILIINGDARVEAGNGVAAVAWDGANLQVNNASAVNAPAVYAGAGGTVTVNGDAYSENKSGVFAEDGTVIVNGDVGSSNGVAGAIAYGEEGYIEVNGNVDSENAEGVVAGDGSTIDVNGDVNSENNVGAEAYNGGTVTVIGDVHSDNDVATAAYDGGTVTVIGDVSSDARLETGIDDEGNEYEYAPEAVRAYGEGSQVTVNGNVYAADGEGVKTGQGATLTVNGNVYSENNSGASAYEGGTTTVNGDVSSINGEGATAGKGDSDVAGTVIVSGSAYSENNAAVNAYDGSTIIIGGNAYSENSTAANAFDGSTVIIYGDASSDAEIVTGIDDEGNEFEYIPEAVTADGEGSTLIVNGNVSSKNGSGVAAYNGGNAEVKGDAYSENGGGAHVNFGGIVTVEGDATSENGSGVFAYDNGTVVVGGNANSVNGDGVDANGDVSVTVNGNASSENGLGVAAYDGGSVEVKGDAYSDSHIGAQSWGDGSKITVEGNVYSDKSVGASAFDEGTLIINGSVTGGSYIDDEGNAIWRPAIYADNSSNILVGQDVNAGGIDGNGAMAISISLQYENGLGNIMVLGDINQTGDTAAIAYETWTYDEDGNRVQIFSDYDNIINALPEIIVNSISCNSRGEYVWVMGYTLDGDDEEDAIMTNVEYPELMSTINYLINHDDGVTVLGAENYTAIDGNDYLIAKEDTVLTLSVNDGYSVVGLTPNDDGTYTITVPRGGGINIKTMQKLLSTVARITSVEETEDGTSITIDVSDTNVSGTQTQHLAQYDLQDVEENGTLEIVSDTLVSFNKDEFEELSQRPDISISVTYVYEGITYNTVIPAGYPLLDLLDENGYCGCLYLSTVFGTVIIE